MTSETIPNKLPYVLAMTGASGSRYGLRLMEVMLQSGCEVHLTISPSAGIVFQTEVNRTLDLKQVTLDDLYPDAEWTKAAEDRFSYYTHLDFGAGMASGSFRTAGMAIVPCSMGTLSSIAHGLSGNLIQRAADVHLKERRKLIVVPRETPLGTIQLRNMTTLSEAGAIILPAMPGFYRQPETVDDLVDFVVARILDQLELPNTLMQRWGDGK
ncbi:putative aromatic acid decarboxylase [Polystyrenella longa]|uniref:Flavin prenyltransferase UbiX n=1 Tax=Polystyrenella longa TaxID=2528007 RepID=A0A518CJZ9_9PLAN|nr:flavin prenyltransferase UbiX [Polystyrenella longa]QDU79556.1 putative aromatic acid decarboxylase [Polystyrenella longa]